MMIYVRAFFVFAFFALSFGAMALVLGPALAFESDAGAIVTSLLNALAWVVPIVIAIYYIKHNREPRY